MLTRALEFSNSCRRDNPPPDLSTKTEAMTTVVLPGRVTCSRVKWCSRRREELLLTSSRCGPEAKSETVAGFGVFLLGPALNLVAEDPAALLEALARGENRRSTPVGTSGDDLLGSSQPRQPLRCVGVNSRKVPMPQRTWRRAWSRSDLKYAPSTPVTTCARLASATARSTSVSAQ